MRSTRFVIGLFLMTCAGSAKATVDSWQVITYPLADIQLEGRNCVAQTITLDPISSGAHATARLIAAVLSQPIVVPNPLGVEPKTTDANAITDQAKAPLTATFEIDGDGGPAAHGRLTIDATALAAANGSSPEGRQDTVLRTKQLVAFSLRNFLQQHSSAAIVLVINGLPTQDGLSGPKLPATFKSAVSATSPWLRTVNRELQSKRGCPQF